MTATANDGYTFANWTENGNVVSTEANYSFIVNGNRNLVANFVNDGGGNNPTGAINGKFTINSNGDQVCFSQGNLQYQASTDTWRFAENQWDYVGEANANISPTYDGWIDLFGWGTGDNPTNSSTSNSDYSNFTDWGANSISNGGNQANTWRTLTYDEWNYLMFNRITTSGIRYAKASLNGVNGVIVLPDDWNASYYMLNNTNSTSAGFASNTITLDDWEGILETNGVVFLPVAGARDGTSVFDVGTLGHYWSSTPNDSGDAGYLYFYSNFLYLKYDRLPRNGHSVRLVADE